jgi:hypothetical protein
MRANVKLLGYRCYYSGGETGTRQLRIPAKSSAEDFTPLLKRYSRQAKHDQGSMQGLDQGPGMRFEIISNDLKCILFDKYGFLKIKSPIHVYQYEIPVPRLSMNLTQECILSLSNVSDTPVDSATSRVPRPILGIRNNIIIRSGMKSILNFRHNIEKYGFLCIEFGKAHPWPGLQFVQI